jgi:hypothetical protein
VPQAPIEVSGNRKIPSGGGCFGAANPQDARLGYICLFELKSLFDEAVQAGIGPGLGVRKGAATRMAPF